MRRLFLITFFLLLFGLSPALGAKPTVSFSVGDKAPEFTLTSTKGLFDYVTQIYGSHHLVLTFFPAAFTPV